MAEPNTTDRILQTLSRILAEAAFVFTDTLDESARPDGSWCPIGVSLRFHGSPRGEGRIWVDKELASCAAANMRGLDLPPEDLEKATDAVRELLNIILGNLLTDLYGEDSVFELGLPEDIPSERYASDALSPGAVWIQAEDTPVLFILETPDD